MFCSGVVASQAAPQTVLLLNSESGDWVGAGENHEYRPEDGAFTFRLAPSEAHVSFYATDPQHFWFLDFAAPADTEFLPGQYEQTSRWPFQPSTMPGMTVSGDGRGCNSTSGRFIVWEFEKDDAGNVQKFAVDFEHHCEGAKAALFGVFRYNSEVGVTPRISVGNSVSQKGNAGTSDAVVTVSLSMPSNHKITAYYTTADGSAKSGTDYQPTKGKVEFQPGQTSRKIVIPVIGNRKQRGDRQFLVRLKSATAELGDTEADVEIVDPNVPMTAITLNSLPGDYIGLGRSWLIAEHQIAITAQRNMFGGVSVETGHPLSFAVSLSGPDNSLLVPGTYADAQPFSSSVPGKPGIGVAGDGRGCGHPTGRFEVSKARYASDGSILRFAASFKQFCNLQNAPLYGSVSVKSRLRQASITNARFSSSHAYFTITLNPRSKKKAKVEFSTVDGSAFAGVHYVAKNAEVVFQPGQSRKVVKVKLLHRASGRQFFGMLTATKIPLWINRGRAQIP